MEKKEKVNKITHLKRGMLYAMAIHLGPAMTPENVLQRFAEQYVMGAMPLDEATSGLADWISNNAHQLTLRDLALLHAVGGALFDRVIADKIRESKYSGIAADRLIDLIRRRK